MSLRRTKENLQHVTSWKWKLLIVSQVTLLGASCPLDHPPSSLLFTPHFISKLRFASLANCYNLRPDRNLVHSSHQQTASTYLLMCPLYLCLCIAGISRLSLLSTPHSLLTTSTVLQLMWTPFVTHCAQFTLLIRRRQNRNSLN